MFVDSDGRQVEEVCGEQRETKKRVHSGIETLDQLL